MNTFEHINNIINHKKPYTLKEGDGGDFMPYMLQRWISMISPEMCYIINETTNTHHKAMKDKQMWHDGFLGMIPKVGYKKINYLKKTKTPPSEDVTILARRLEISCREAKELLEIDKSLNKKDKSVEISKKKS